MAGEDIDRLQREDVRIEARSAPSAKVHIFPAPSEHMLVADDVLGRGGVIGCGGRAVMGERKSGGGEGVDRKVRG